MGSTSLDDLYALDPVEFERLVGTVFAALGYDVRVTKRSGDEGIDLELRRGDERSLAQCKRYRGTVGQPEIRDFYGVLIHEKAARGYFVTTGQFSLAASTWAQGKQIALTDGVDLLSALENSGLVPAPRAKAPFRDQTAGTELEVIVQAAQKDPATSGRILLDGAPPDGHTYRRVADYLEQHFPKQTDSTNSSKVKGWNSLWGWAMSAARIRFIDEFDDLARTSMERILEWQTVGIEEWTERPQLPPFVLVATVWEKRLPKAVRARFSTVIPVHELDWRIFEKRKKSSPDSHARAAAELGLRERQVQKKLKLEKMQAREQSRAEAEQWREKLKLERERFELEKMQALEQARADAPQRAAAALEMTRRRTNEANLNYRATYARTPRRNAGAGSVADFIQRFAPASVLDVHCGAGRVARELALRGVDVVGVEPDSALFGAARKGAKQLRRKLARHGVDVVLVEPHSADLNAARRAADSLLWYNADIAEINLRRRFDAVVMADDGILNLPLGSEGVAISKMARHLKPGGVLIVSFRLIPDLLTVDTYDEFVAQSGLVFVERWSGWDCTPWSAARKHVLSVHRKPDENST